MPEVQKPSLLTPSRGEARNKENKSQVVVLRNFWFSGDGLSADCRLEKQQWFHWICCYTALRALRTVVELDRTIYLSYARRILEYASLEFGK